MFKNNYYCLVAGLPDLLFSESKPGFSSLDFRTELKEQLSVNDFNLVKQVFLLFDNQNLLNLIFKLNKPFNTLGIISKEKLEAEIIKPSEIPDYMIQYIKWIRNQESMDFSLPKENQLYHLFYNHILQQNNEFLIDWYTFYFGLKNILTAINCKQFNYEIENHIIQFGANNIIHKLLLNNRLNQDYFEDEIQFAEQIFRIAKSETNSIEKEKEIDKLKWNYLDENTFFHYFTIEKLLSFAIKLIIIERWMKLDNETGKELLKKLVYELELSYEFPAEFSSVK